MKKLGFVFLFLLLFPGQIRAWNPDAYGLPQERRMCVQREADGIRFVSIEADQDCEPGAQRYIVIFAREPRGAIALIPTTTSLRFYPPLTLNWPANEEFSGSPLWHFTCVNKQEISPLGIKVSLNSYRGEITFQGKQDCLEAEQRALKFCQQEWRGEALLESCPLSMGGQ